MKLSDFDFEYPDELIADHPLPKRDHARMMLLERSRHSIDTTHHVFDLPQILRANDLLILNDSRVFPARLIGQKESGGGAELLLLMPLNPERDQWRAMATKLNRLRVGGKIYFPQGLEAEILSIEDETLTLRLNRPELIEAVGLAPLPPYIEKMRKKSDPSQDKERYQTVYARETGSAAAPTAGLHITRELISAFGQKGIEVDYVTLHVGRDTFLPVRVDDITTHKMHGEHVSISQKSAEKINRAKAEGRRVIAVGTTSVRSLESAAKSGKVAAGSFVTHAFIYPDYTFQIIDGLITNFHQPKSTLLMMISAFAGMSFVKQAYQRAIDERFRLFSYGDCVVIV